MANLPLQYVTDKSGNKVWPITHIAAVRDSNGTSLAELLGGVAFGGGIQRAIYADSSLKLEEDSSIGLNLVHGNHIALTWVPAGVGTGLSGSTDYGSLKIDITGMDDNACLVDDDSSAYGADDESSNNMPASMTEIAQEAFRAMQGDLQLLPAGTDSQYLMVFNTSGVPVGKLSAKTLVNNMAVLGNGFGTCATDSSVLAKEVVLNDYELVKNGTIAVSFDNDVSANATLNVNDKGAKPVLYKGSAIEDGVIKGGDTVMFTYDGSNYNVSSIGGGASADGGIIVSSSGSTLAAEVGKYYRYDTEVSSLTVTLPSTSSLTSAQKIMIYFQAGASNALTLSSTDDIQYMNGYDIESGSTYEVTIMWNGYSWIVTSLFLGEKITLPSGAQRIEYLESTGTQYINTGYRFTNGSAREFEFLINPAQNFSAIIFGANSSTNEVFFTGTAGWLHAKSFAMTGVLSNRLFPNRKYKAVVNSINGNASITIDNTLIVTSTGNTAENYEYLFCGVTNDVISNYNKMRYYTYKRYENANLVIDFIPVRVGQVGAMYNKVNGQLYYNAGTGDFILGPDI